jgi:hypothetical protein
VEAGSGEIEIQAGPCVPEFHHTFSPDGVRHLDLTGPDGKVYTPSLPWSDGKEVSVEGMDDATATSKIQGRTLHDIWKQDGKVTENVQGVVSRDEKTMKTTVDGTDSAGHKYHNELIFEKQGL